MKSFTPPGAGQRPDAAAMGARPGQSIRENRTDWRAASHPVGAACHGVPVRHVHSIHPARSICGQTGGRVRSFTRPGTLASTRTSTAPAFNGALPGCEEFLIFPKNVRVVTLHSKGKANEDTERFVRYEDAAHIQTSDGFSSISICRFSIVSLTLTSWSASLGQATFTSKMGLCCRPNRCSKRRWARCTRRLLQCEQEVRETRGSAR